MFHSTTHSLWCRAQCTVYSVEAVVKRGRCPGCVGYTAGQCVSPSQNNMPVMPVQFVHTHSACRLMQYMPHAASRVTYNVLLCHQLNLGLDIPSATGVHDNPHSRAKPRRNLPSSSRAHAVHAGPLVQRRGIKVIHGRHRSKTSDLLPCVGHHDRHRVPSSCAENPEVKATRPHI